MSESLTKLAALAHDMGGRKRMKNPLVEVAESVKSELLRGEKVAVIFDLDSTLFCVAPRTQAILHKLGSTPEFEALNSDDVTLKKAVEAIN